MNRFLQRTQVAVLIALFATSILPEAQAKIRFSATSGHSFATAIIVKGANNEMEGVSAEYAWLRKNRPGWKVVSQSLLDNAGRTYDLMEIAKGNQKEEIYFDISGYFGKY